MKRPFRYHVYSIDPYKFLYGTNQPPRKDELEEWAEVDCADIDGNLGRYELRQTKEAREDTRYPARIRLWNYINYGRKGLPMPRLRPLEGTEIGKSLPILNF